MRILDYIALVIAVLAMLVLVSGCGPTWDCTGRRSNGECNAWRKA